MIRRDEGVTGERSGSACVRHVGWSWEEDESRKCRQVRSRYSSTWNRVMGLSKHVSSWSVEEVLEWLQEQHPSHVSRLQKAIIKHAVSGRALLRLKNHHLELLGLEDEEQQQEILQDLLLLRVQEEISELTDIYSDCFSP
ncbi:hypothetical protein Q5P01_004733 [Channa striata]|uniref:SAM domain-containing protein n=1 Tax=Channa striata TaxID=64152 RepID=A0AA88SXU8_CHASR|nr:hypothetical protein Q5P01_004733 [Channa striata]